MLHKIYRSNATDTRYSPAKCIGCVSEDIIGTPDVKHIGTSYVERQNLTMRMDMRRFTRLMRIPVHREHPFRFNVNTDSGDGEHRFRSS